MITENASKLTEIKNTFIAILTDINKDIQHTEDTTLYDCDWPKNILTKMVPGTSEKASQPQCKLKHYNLQGEKYIKI